MPIRVCRKGHITGYRNCPRCNEEGNAEPPARRKPKRPSVKDTPTRESARAELFRRAIAAVNYQNLREIGESHFVGMPRRDRRALARAYAKGAWKQARAAKAAA